jgi:Protein of unknown function (DUF1553)/Protein of unknown function (DUF1549)
MCRHLSPVVAALAMVVLCTEAAQAQTSQPLADPSRRWSADGPGGVPSFTKHIVPLLSKAGCSNRACHGSFQGQNGFRLSLFGYDPLLDHRELTTDEGKGPRVNTKDVDRSLALLKPLGEVEHDGGMRFSRDSWKYRMFRAWIAGGARFDPQKEPYLQRLEIIPNELLLKENSKPLSLRVVAHYSDGSQEYVTSLTGFSSNDDSVVQVDKSGTVTVSGKGDTAVVVSYAGGVVACQVLVPSNPGKAFPPFPANNRGDDLVAAKLRKVGIHPSGLSTDDQFIRRAYVDTIGTLPTATEVRDFLSDQRPDKRPRLIDRLLARPEYAMYWATIFSDWTGNNTLTLNPFFKCNWLWHDWLRDKLGRNVPYDELVGGIMTATSREGRSLEEYLAENKKVQANIKERRGFDDGTYGRRKTLDLYWMKRGGRAEEMAIRTANAFLGVQIQCAQCHKHPFDRWTQDDFTSFTSFFRVTSVCDLDGSDRSGGRMDYDKVAVYPGVDARNTNLVKQHPPKILGGPVVPYRKGGQDPRELLWQWMRSPDNPTFARNIANRLWGHYFGRGIIDPVDDSNAANPPSNPQLLDWLARDFIEHRFDLKHLHRRILNSRTYQLSDVPNESNRTDQRNYSHALIKRMPAEVLFDALAQITGTPQVYSTTFVPPGTRAIGLAPPARYGTSPEYVLRIFGRPKREQTCSCERSDETNLAQALFLINDVDVQSRVEDPRGRLSRLLKSIPDDRKLIEELYLTTLSRYPRPDEMKKVLAYVAKANSRQAAMQDVLWSLINVREFLFVR